MSTKVFCDGCGTDLWPDTGVDTLGVALKSCTPLQVHLPVRAKVEDGKEATYCRKLVRKDFCGGCLGELEEAVLKIGKAKAPQ